MEHTDFDANLLHEKTHIAADTGMVDDGSGKKDIFRLVGKDLVAVPTTDHGKFYAGDCYIITYTYHVGGAERCIIYYWLVTFILEHSVSVNRIENILVYKFYGDVCVRILLRFGKIF